MPLRSDTNVDPQKRRRVGAEGVGQEEVVGPEGTTADHTGLLVTLVRGRGGTRSGTVRDR